jgi:hypothetical protein
MILIRDLSPDGTAVDRNLVPAFTWNAGGLGPDGIYQNGIDIHIYIIWLDSIMISRVIEQMCVFPSVLRVPH